MRTLLKRKAMIHALKEKELVRKNGAWEYADADCFIRVNEDSACILLAAELDFSVPGKHTRVRLYDNFMRKRMFAEVKEFHGYVFSSKDKIMVRVQVERADSLLKWIAEHGGRTALKAAFFRSSVHGAAFDLV